MTMYPGREDQIRQLLAETGRLSPRQLDEAAAERAETGRSTAEIALARGWIERAGLLAAIAEHVGGEPMPTLPRTLPSDVPGVISPQQARSQGLVPVGHDHGVLLVAALDPLQPDLAEATAFMLGRPVRLAVAEPAGVEALIQRHYGEPTDAAGVVTAEADEPVEASAADLAVLAAQTPVVRYVNSVLAQAVRDRASDVHFEPFEHEFRIRCRIDGALIELPPPPRALAPAVASRLKVLAGLDIAERRQPQDGRLRIGIDGRVVDLRVATLPTQGGESVVLRVLDRESTGLEIEQLGMPRDILEGVRRAIGRPGGLFIVTGPTGSGKTTTLYSCLKRLNAVDSKLLTIEDPVEYEIEGVMQVPVNPAAGLNFAAALRAFLRHDPDVVMVGEIRDVETARIAAQAALTGHLVLTTLHTSDAAGAVTRLTDMEVEPFLLASTLEAVLAQRLVRRICPDCREEHAPDPAALARLGVAAAPLADRMLARGRGCRSCRGSGYRGRLAFFELLTIDEPTRELIAAAVPLEHLREHARSRGLRTLQEDGLRLAATGETTLEELARYL